MQSSTSTIEVPAPAGVEAEDRLAVALAEGVLELVAVAPLLHRRLDLLQLEAVEAADPAQRLLDLLALVLELALVGEALPGAPGQGSPSCTQLSATRSAPGRSSSTARASAKRRFALVISARTRSPGKAPATKTTCPSQPGHAAPTEGERLDLDLELLSPRGAGPPASDRWPAPPS